MSCGCSKNAESCGCGSKVMNWESYDRPSKTMMAESWGETDQATMEEFFGYYDASPDQRVAIMLEEDEFGYDLPSLVWYFQNSLNGQGDWMTANYGKDSVEEALARVQGRMGIPNKFGFSAEEPTVQEPDFMPNGDGRAIGQQNFAINLSPLHAETFNAEAVENEIGCDKCGRFAKLWSYANFDLDLCAICSKKEGFRAESRFDKLSNEIADEYEEKGMSPEKAQEVGDATAAKIGRAKYGKTGMRKMQKKGMKADMVGSPSPTFNENITGQDGPSENPTNQVFNAMRRMAPSSRDVESARRMLSGSGYGTVIYDRYLVNQQGSSNKFYYTAISEKDGQYFPMGAYGRIGYLGTLFNVAGKKERPYTSYPTMEQAYRQIREKEEAKINARKSEKKYVDYTLSRGAETLAEIEGPTAEATSGGLHSPSSFDITWEDGMGQSSASLPPNEIAWAETKGSSLGTILAIGVASAVGYFGYKKMAASKVDDKKAEKGCGTCKKSENRTVRKDSEFSVGQINPVEVEGQNDVYGAEELSSPQTSAKVAEPNWGPQSTHLSNQRPSQKMW